MSKGSIAEKKFEDFTIYNNDKKRVGSLRIKPNKILWAPKGAHKWRGVDWGTFAEFMEGSGTLQAK